ncbi:unnamed protein product [Prunus armeniaca]
MKRTHRVTTEASSSRSNRQQVEDVGPTHDSNVDAEVEDVVATHDSNVEIHVEPTKPSRQLQFGIIRNVSSLGACRRHLPFVSGISGNADKIVVSTFVEWWHPETNTFHIPFGEMTITLDDVSSILGIPVFGAAVAPLEDDNDTNFELSVKYLRVTGEEATEQLHQYSDEYVSLSLLRARFSNVSDTDSKEYIMYSTIAYFLYLLGCTLFVDKTSMRVQIVYLRLLRNLDSVAGYPWGSGCLAWLYRQIGQALRSKVK